MTSGQTAVLNIGKIGGKGGRSASNTLNGKRLTQIQVWTVTKDHPDDATDERIRGLKLWMSDVSSGTDLGNETMFGMQGEGTPSPKFRLTAHDKITELTLWDNGKQDYSGRLGRIKMTVADDRDGSRQRKFEYGIDIGGQTRSVTPDVGSGICCGYEVRYGDDIDELGFYFLRPIKKAEITKVTYDQTALGNLQFNDKVVYDMSQTAKETAVTWEWSGSIRKELSSNWTFGGALVVGKKVNVNAGVPFLEENEGKYKWGTSGLRSFESTNETSTKTFDMEFKDLILDADSTTKVTVSLAEGTIRGLPYKATMKLISAGNYFISEYPIQGIYEGKSIAKELKIKFDPEKITKNAKIITNNSFQITTKKNDNDSEDE